LQKVKNSGKNSKTIEKKIIKENGLRLDESGPSDESRGSDSITVRYHHSHWI